MVESMAPTQEPNEKLLVAYKEWAEGGWGMILTGIQITPNLIIRTLIKNISRKCASFCTASWRITRWMSCRRQLRQATFNKFRKSGRLLVKNWGHQL
jgi:hypothetical protein